jgi:hypothetical protein
MHQGIVCRVQDETIERYAMGRLSGSSLVRFEQHLLLCEQCQSSAQQADLYVAVMRSALARLDADHQGDERRREPRRACSRSVRIRLSGMRRSVRARATDRSRSGFGLTAAVGMPAGARVILAIGGRLYHGEVAWCAQQGPQYRLGVRLAAFAGPASRA